MHRHGWWWWWTRLCQVEATLPHLGRVEHFLPNHAMRAAMDGGCALFSPRVSVHGRPEGPLRGLTFVAKDLFAVKGWRTSFGTPKWRDTHEAAQENALAVEMLLQSGADLVGMAHMDEMAYSLNGENAQFGTPINPRCVERVPGGSSSGSASAVASNLSHFGLGTDTAGSVRVPGSYCGLFGIRPTHGRVSLHGACPLAPSFDTAGWLAKDADTLQKVGLVLLDQSSTHRNVKRPKKWLVGMDALELANVEVADRLKQTLLQGKRKWEEVLGPQEEVQVGNDEAGKLQDWIDIFRVCQGAEVWTCHGEWITKQNPDFGPGIRERFAMASKITQDELLEANKRRDQVKRRMAKLLHEDAVLIVPTTPGPAPLKNTPQEELEQFRRRLISVTSIASLAGLPEVTLPVLTGDGCPVGISLVGAPGSDESLLDVAGEVFAMLVD
eukprot:scaffold76_cov363-Pavlova_lutheri.AAC.9